MHLVLNARLQHLQQVREVVFCLQQQAVDVVKTHITWITTKFLTCPCCALLLLLLLLTTH